MKWTGAPHKMIAAPRFPFRASAKMRRGRSLPGKFHHSTGCSRQVDANEATICLARRASLEVEQSPFRQQKSRRIHRLQLQIRSASNDCSAQHSIFHLLANGFAKINSCVFFRHRAHLSLARSAVATWLAGFAGFAALVLVFARRRFGCWSRRRSRWRLAARVFNGTSSSVSVARWRLVCADSGD